MDTLAAKIETAEQKRKALDAELQKDRAELLLLLNHPRGELPDAVPSSVTAAAASALQAAEDEKRRRDEAEAIRLESDLAAVAKARRDRLDKLQRLAFQASDPPVSAAPGRRALTDSPEQHVHRPAKKTRFAEPIDSDTEDHEEEELSIVPPVLSRPKYLTDASKLLLYLVNSTCSPCPPVIPALQAAQTLVYAAALAHVNGQLRFNFGADQPSFQHILCILRELPQFFPALFENKPEKEALATTALTKWHRHFNDQLTRLLSFADHRRDYVENQFIIFIASLDEAVPSTFDPVAIIKKHVTKLATDLTAQRSKLIMRGMFPAPAKSNGSCDKDSGTNWGGAGEGGDVDQIPGPGPPGSFWHWSHDCFVRYEEDASGHRLTHICMMCGWSGTPSHNASHCPADESDIENWVVGAIPVE